MNKREALKILHEVIGDHRQTSKNEHYFKCPACDHYKYKLAIICNYRNGTEYRTGQILKDLLTSLWSEAIEKTKKKWNSQKSS
jgi:hypothetical protein